MDFIEINLMSILVVLYGTCSANLKGILPNSISYI